MTYELFTAKKYKRRQGTPTLTVKTNGDITFNTASKETLKSVTYVQILYDKTRKKICLRRCRKNSPGALKILKTKHYIRIYAKTAFKQWNIFPKKNYQRPLTLKDNEIIFGIQRKG